MNTPSQKHRITVTHTFEFDVNPESYVGALTAEDRMKVDRENFQDPWVVAEVADSPCHIKTDVTVELVEGK